MARGEMVEAPGEAAYRRRRSKWKWKWGSAQALDIRILGKTRHGDSGGYGGVSFPDGRGVFGVLCAGGGYYVVEFFG